MREKNTIFKSVIILIVQLSMILSGCSRDFRTDYYIFADISECEQLISEPNKNITVTRYASPTEDKSLKRLEYNSFFAAEYSSDSLKFEIFAYEFASTNISKQYFKNCTGKERVDDCSFLASSNRVKYELVVFENERAYTVLCKDKDSKKVNIF